MYLYFFKIIKITLMDTLQHPWGYLQNNNGRFAAELQGDPLECGGGLLLDQFPDLGGAGERDLVNVGVVDDGGSGRWTETGDDVHHARREPGLLS